MTMIRKTGSLMAILALAWVLTPLSAQAATTWNTTVTPTTTVVGTTKPQGNPSGSGCVQSATPAFGCANYGNQFQFNSTSGNLPLNATAYYVTTNATSSTLQAASIQEYVGNGIGVTSLTTASATYGSDPTPTTTQFPEDIGNSPGHTIDNQGVYDMVVFQLPSSNFDVTQIALKTFSSTQYASGAADFTILVGGNASANALTLAGFAGKSLAQLTGTGAGNYGFTELNYSHSTGGTFNVNPGNLTGHYLIVIASLTNTNRNDDFKVSSIVGTTLTTKVAEPSSIAVLLAAALSMFYFQRRRSAARC